MNIIYFILSIVLKCFKRINATLIPFKDLFSGSTFVMRRLIFIKKLPYASKDKWPFNKICNNSYFYAY